LGKDSAPNPSRLLAAAVASCLSGSLVFCMSKAKLPLRHLAAEVKTQLVRNERNRLRIGKLEVTLHPELSEDSASAASCLEVFEDFCVVTESVRNGIEVDVTVDLS
jgi:organic hydroperoxide reductase OsmC/OhrA